MDVHRTVDVSSNNYAVTIQEYRIVHLVVKIEFEHVLWLGYASFKPIPFCC